MLEAIITSSVLILVVCAQRFLLKGKISLRLQYALWLVVAVRLLLPFPLFKSSVSVMNAVDPLRLVSSIVARNDGSVPPGILKETALQSENDKSEAGMQGSQKDAPTEPTNDSKEIVVPQDLKSIAIIVWVCGAAIIFLWLVLKNLIFYRMLRQHRVSIEIKNIKLKVYVVDKLPSPCIFGLCRPAVYLTPYGISTKAQRDHIIAHELTHYTHLDHLWVYLRGICIVVHWFNPLVWIAAVLSRRDCELACDEGTLKKIGEEQRIEYGDTLINMVAVKKLPSELLCLATTMTVSKKDMKERILMIANKPKMLITTAIVVILIIAATVGCTFTGADANTQTMDVNTNTLVPIQSSAEPTPTVINSIPSLIPITDIIMPEFAGYTETDAEVYEMLQDALNIGSYYEGHGRVILGRMDWKRDKGEILYDFYIASNDYGINSMGEKFYISDKASKVFEALDIRGWERSDIFLQTADFTDAEMEYFLSIWIGNVMFEFSLASPLVYYSVSDPDDNGRRSEQGTFISGGGVAERIMALFEVPEDKQTANDIIPFLESVDSVFLVMDDEVKLPEDISNEILAIIKDLDFTDGAYFYPSVDTTELMEKNMSIKLVSAGNEVYITFLCGYNITAATLAINSDTANDLFIANIEDDLSKLQEIIDKLT